MLRTKGNTINSIKASEVSNEGISKKRKMTEDLDSPELLKIMKHNDTSDTSSLKKMQRQKHSFFDEHSLADEVLKDISTVVSATKPIHKDAPVSFERNITVKEYEYKENIDVDKCKDVLYKCDKKKIECSSTQSTKNNAVLNNSNSNKNFSVKGSKSNSVKDEQSDDVSVSEDIEQLNNLNKSDKSDVVLETCITDDFNDCFEEEWFTDNQINFNSLQRCRVIDVKREHNSLLLTVEDEDFASSTTVMCLGFW